MNWIKAFFKWLGAGSPERTNITGTHEAMTCRQALERLAADGGGRVQRFNWSPDHFIDYSPNRLFREFSCGHYTPDHVWEMTPAELEDWMVHHRIADYVSSDWVVTIATSGQLRAKN